MTVKPLLSNTLPMTIGRMNHVSDNIQNQEDVKDFSTLENGQNKEFYEKITDFINKRVDKKVDDPKTLKDMKDAMDKSVSFDDWFDDNKIYAELYEALLEEMKPYSAKFKKEFKELNDAVVAFAKIKGLDFQLTDQGKAKINAVTSNSNTVQNSIANKSTPSTIEGREEYDNKSRKLTKKERKELEKNPEKQKKLNLIEGKGKMGDDTGVFYEANQYVDHWETKVYDKTEEKYVKESEADDQLRVKARDWMNPNNKHEVRRSFELFFDNEEGKELRIQNFPIKMFTEPHGFFDVMRSLSDVLNNDKKFGNIDKDTVKDWINNGFDDIKPKDIKELGMKQPRALKMVKILQRAKWEDLQLLSSILSNAPSVERGITELWNAYSRTGYVAETADTDQQRTEKKRFQNISEKYEDVLNEDTVFDFLTDWNMDLSDAVGSDKYEAGKKVGKLQRHKEFKFLGDVGPTFGPQVKFTIESVSEQLDVVYGKGKGEQVVIENVLREMYGQLTMSEYMNEGGVRVNDFWSTAAAQALKTKIEGFIDNPATCNKKELAKLVKEQPYFHTMFKAAIFTMAGGNETAESAPNPVNLDDVLRGRTLDTIARERKDAVYLDLRTKINDYLTDTQNPELRKYIEQEGLVKAKHTILTGIMTAVHGMTMRGNIGSYAGLLDAQAQQTAILETIAQNIKQMVVGGDLGVTLPLAQWESKIGPNGRGLQKGQVFAGVQTGHEGILRGPAFVLGVRQSIEGRLDKQENIELRNMKPAKYLGAEAELMGKLDTGNLSKSDIELSAGLSYTTRHVEKIHEADDYYSQALKNAIEAPSRSELIGITSKSELITYLKDLKNRSVQKLNKKNKFYEKNSDVLRDNMDVVFAMVEKEFSRPENMSLLQSNEGADIMYDLMIGVSSACVNQWKDGQISALQNQLKVTGFSAGVRVSLMKTINAVATSGASLATDVALTQQLPIDAYIGMTLSTWRMKHYADAEQMMDRQNKFMRGYGEDPFDTYAADPRKNDVLPISERTTEKYAKYLEALYNSDYLEVESIAATDGGGGKLLKLTLKDYKGAKNIADFLNLHVTDEAIKNETFSLKDNVLIVGQSDLHTGTIVEGQGVRRLMSIGGPIAPRNKHGIYEYDNDASSQRVSKNFETDQTKIKGFEEPKKIVWTPEKFDDVKNGVVADFIDGLENHPDGGQNVIGMVDAAKDYFYGTTVVGGQTFQQLVESHGDTDFSIDLDFKKDTNGVWVIDTVNLVDTSDYQITVTMQEELLQETINNVTNANLDAMIATLAAKPTIAQALTELGKTEADLKQMLAAKGYTADDLKKIEKIAFVKTLTGAFTIDVTMSTQPHMGDVVVSMTYEKETTGPDVMTDLGSVDIVYDYKGDLKDLLSDLRMKNAEFSSIDTLPKNRKLYYEFMAAASNVDGSLTNGYDLDKNELDKAVAVLKNMLTNAHNTTRVGNIQTFIDKFDRLNDGDKMLVVNRFKQMFSLVEGLHNSSTSVDHLLSSRTYMDLEGSTGERLDSSMESVFTRADNYFKSIDSSSSRYSLSGEHPKLIGYSAFYRKGGESVALKNKRWSLTAPGVTDVLSKGGRDFIAPVEASDVNLVKSNFLKFFKEDLYTHELIKDQFMEQIRAKFPNLTMADLTKENITTLIETGSVLVTGTDGKKVKIDAELDWKMYLMGQCGNRSFGFEIKSLKIAEGKPTIDQVTVGDEVRDKFHGEKDVKIDAEASDDAPSIEEIEGTMSLKSSDQSVAMRPDADRKDIHMRLGIPLITRKKATEFPDDTLTGDSGWDTGNSVGGDSGWNSSGLGGNGSSGWSSGG